MVQQFTVKSVFIDMITIVSGTNRRNNLTRHFSRCYYELIKAKTDQRVELLLLDEIDQRWMEVDMYNVDHLSPAIHELHEQYILPAEKFVFLSPEYNGSFPGVLKLLLDALSVFHTQKSFLGKKAGLIGIASGRAGNQRGMDHLATILHYMGVHILPNKLPISSIIPLLDPDGQLIDEPTKEAMSRHVEAMLLF